MLQQKKKRTKLGLTASIILTLFIIPVARAQVSTNAELTQEITEGVISTSIRDNLGAVVLSPAFAMSALVASTSQQTSTGVFGTNAQRITVDNPSGSLNGGAWTLALNATTPGTGVWTSGVDSYAYNGSTAAEGQLTVNPSTGNLTAVVGGSTGVALGGQATFSGTTPVSIITASTSAAPIWNGYVTGVGLSQTVPASQPIGNYTIDMTQTVTAL